MYLRYHIPSPSEHNHHHHHHHHHSLARAGGGVVKVVVQKMSWLLHVAFCCSSLALPRVAHTANHRQIEITWRDARVAAAVSKSFVLCPCFLFETHLTVVPSVYQGINQLLRCCAVTTFGSKYRFCGTAAARLLARSATGDF